MKANGHQGWLSVHDKPLPEHSGITYTIGHLRFEDYVEFNGDGIRAVIHGSFALDEKHIVKLFEEDEDYFRGRGRYAKSAIG